MRRGSSTVLAGLLVLALLPAALGLPSPSDPDLDFFDSPCAVANDRRFVYDYVGLLDLTEGEYVEERGCALYQEDGAHLVLVLVPDLDGQSIDAFAVDLVRDWGIGDEDRLDGLLVLYAQDDGSGSGSGVLRVEVGYGLEGVVNSLVARQAVDGAADLKRRAMENGSSEAEATAHALASATAGLALFTQTNHEGVPGERAPGGGGGSGPTDLPWWAWLLILAVLLSLLGAGRRGRGSFLGGLILGGMMRRGGRGGGGMGGGGGGWGGRRGGSGGFGVGKSGGGGWGGKL